MLQNLLNTDTLTGAFTRVKFDNEIKKQIAFSQQTGRKMSLAIFDIDNFKRINDTYGHLEGDNVLSGIANIVIENLRLRDILTRWGGEEFVIVFPCTGLASAVKTAERLRIKISDAAFSIGEVVTCSFGVTEFKKGDTPVSLLRRADNLLYEAKASGKNVVCAN
jgi:diguanylate cyclase (GGDEF)-like protein